MALSEEWARTIAKYPERFGKLSALYYQLLREADAAGLSSERVEYFHSRIRGIDNPLPPVYDVRKLTNANKVPPEQTVGE